MKPYILRHWGKLRQKKLTLMAVPSDGTRPKSLVVSYQVLLNFLIIGITGLVVAALLFAASYWQVKKLSRLKLELEQGYAENALLRAYVQDQEEQLSELMKRIAEMESKLTDMGDMSAKIYAMLEDLGIDVSELPPLDQANVVTSDAGSWAASLSHTANGGADSSKLTEGRGGPLLTQLYHSVNALEQLIPVHATNLGQIREALEEKRQRLERTPSIWPADGWVSSGFGRRRDPFTGKYAYHEGVDIANHKGTPVHAAAAGVVTYAGYMSGYGNVVIINHGFGMETRYGHLQRLLVTPGDMVAKGQQIATMGSTGRSTGPHLHYEVRINGKPVSPFHYLPDRQSADN